MLKEGIVRQTLSEYNAMSGIYLVEALEVRR